MGTGLYYYKRFEQQYAEYDSKLEKSWYFMKMVDSCDTYIEETQGTSTAHVRR